MDFRIDWYRTSKSESSSSKLLIKVTPINVEEEIVYQKVILIHQKEFKILEQQIILNNFKVIPISKKYKTSNEFLLLKIDGCKIMKVNKIDLQQQKKKGDKIKNRQQQRFLKDQEIDLMKNAINYDYTLTSQQLSNKITKIQMKFALEKPNDKFFFGDLLEQMFTIMALDDKIENEQGIIDALLQFDRTEIFIKDCQNNFYSVQKIATETLLILEMKNKSCVSCEQFFKETQKPLSAYLPKLVPIPKSIVTEIVPVRNQEKKQQQAKPAQVGNNQIGNSIGNPTIQKSQPTLDKSH